MEKQEGWPGGGDGQQAHTETSQVENSRRHQSLLLVQAHPGSQEHPARHRDANEKLDSSGAKPCTLEELCSSSALKPRMEQGSFHREQRMFTQGCFFTHLLSRVARNPLSARLSIIPRLPLHKNTRHHQDCIQQGFQLPQHRGCQEPQRTPSLFQGCGGLPTPADSSLLHSQ